jgi:hypothetical protein
VVLEEDGEDQLVTSCEEKEVFHNVSEEMYILNTLKTRRANWIGHILRRNCLLKHVVEGTIEGRIRSDGRTRKRR